MAENLVCVKTTLVCPVIVHGAYLCDQSCKISVMVGTVNGSTSLNVACEQDSRIRLLHMFKNVSMCRKMQAGQVSKRGRYVSECGIDEHAFRFIPMLTKCGLFAKCELFERKMSRCVVECSQFRENVNEYYIHDQVLK